MTDPSDLLFNPADPRLSAFAPTSRYFGLPVVKHVGADGETHAYVARRFAPRPEDLASVGEHLVAGGERADVIAAASLGDPELFWRLCDGNRALSAAEVEVTGRRLRITLPAGTPGPAEG